MRRAPYYRIPVDQLIPRPLRADELRDVRRLWWNQRRHEGVELPPEPSAILLKGGKR